MPIGIGRCPSMRIAFLLSISSLLLVATSGCSQKNPIEWWGSINAKAKELKTLEAKYVVLEEEHERLKKDYYRLEHSYMDLKANVDGNEAGELNLKVTGSLTGRTPASIHYEVPKNLRPEEQLALAYEHFTEKRFAEASATFENFLTSPENAAIVDAPALYTAGVSWFEIGNYKKAKEYFEEARNGATGEQREKIQKKVDLWLRTIDRKWKEPSTQENGGSLGAGSHEAKRELASQKNAHSAEPQAELPAEVKAAPHKAAHEPPHEAPHTAPPTKEEGGHGGHH